MISTIGCALNRYRMPMVRISRSGLMVRDALQDGGNNSQGHQVTVAVNAANTYQVLLRNVSFNSAGTQSLPPNPLPVAFGTNSW